MSTILFVEDNPHIMKINSAALTMRDYEVLCADSLGKGQMLLLNNPVDLIVLDVMLPDGSGIEWCHQIKHEYNVPILFLSALGDSRDIVEGLNAGGDDYLAKPYDLEVLIARIEARLRTSGAVSSIVRLGALRLDTISMSRRINGEDLLLTQKEFSVLLLLVQNQGNLVPKEAIYSNVWGRAVNDNYRPLYTVISRIKKKLKTAETGIEIVLKRPEGYMLEKL